MCGIAGIVLLDNSSPYKICKRHLALMNKALLHRGPDDQQLYIDQEAKIGLAFSRLVLLDAQNGAQPMHSPDRLITLVYNGEIYGHDLLRNRLKKKGIHFSSRSDTEVLLNLYQDQGIDCLSQLNGEFAFAIYDKRASAIFIVRDRVGIKPLYYTIQKGILFFASEIKALLSHPYVQASLNFTTIYQQMMRADSLKRTFIKEVEVLPPGRYLAVKHGNIDKKVYWRPSFPSVLADGTQDDMLTAAQKARELLEKAIQQRVVADFEVGAFISGGLDSSIVCAVMQQYSAKPIQTFSLCFEDADYDESIHSRQLASYLGTNHHEIKISNLDLAVNLPYALFHGEHLTQSTDGVGKYLLAKYASKSVKAVMTGEGADELFLGYPWYKTIKTLNDWDVNRAYHCQQLIEQRETARKGFDLTLSTHHDRKEVIMRYGYYPISLSNIQEMEKITQQVFSKEFMAMLTTMDDPREIYTAYMPMNEVIGLTPIDQNRLEFIKTTFPTYVLQYLSGKMEMAHSLEGRLPFLDRYLMDYALALPNHYHLFGMTEKNLLKLAFKDMLPASILWRTKQGYSTPVLKPFLKKKRPEFFDYFLSKKRIQENNIFSFQDIHQTLKTLRHGKLKGQAEILAERKIMFVLSTQLLHDMFITKRPSQFTTYQ